MRSLPLSLRNLFTGVGLLAAPFAVAQVAAQPAPQPAAPAPAPDATLLLSPFVVTADQDSGYAATDSLAGTRLRTPLKDIAASISVVTKDLMEDLSANTTAEILVYTAGTEVVGVGGNYSGSFAESGAQTFDPLRESTSPTTRVRGLAAADETRNYFLSPGIPLDSYNTQSVTLNRGANAILFGFGSPAGIIENTLITPAFKNKAQLKVGGGSYGSYRESLDVERVLVKDKLSFRFAQLDDKRRYEQEYTFRDQERYFGALTYRPFQSTTIRVNAEQGHLDQRLPRVGPPLDSLTTWWDFGKPTRDTDFTSAATKSYQRANNLDGMAGNWSQNVGLEYGNWDQGNPLSAWVPYANAPGKTYRFLAPRSSQEIEASVKLNPLAGFMVAKQLIDRSIFDYRKQLLDGPNSGTWMDFNTQNIAAEQLFLGGDAGIELVYDRQDADSSMLRGIANSYRGNNIFIDVNTTTIDGRPNPNFGRPFIASNGFFNNYESLNETGRATAFLRHDFTQDGKGFFRRLLGTQTVTGMYSDLKRTQYVLGGYPQVIDPAFRDGLNGNTIATSRKITSLVYLGPSLAGASSAAGAHLQGVQNQLLVPDKVNVLVTNPGTGNKWIQQEFPTYDYYHEEDLPYLVNSNTGTYNRAKSGALILQSNWWDNTLVSTLGWRRDEVESSNGTNSATDPVTGGRTLDKPVFGPGLETSKDTFSYGLALHVPQKWMNHIPTAPSATLYYNESENFDVSAGVRNSILGVYLPPQEGTTREFGIGFGLFDNRLTLRATHYETTQENMTDSRLTSALVRVADLEDRITGSLSKAFLDSIGYVGFDSPNASPIFKQYLENYNFRVGETRADGTRVIDYESPAGTVETTSSISKGWEFEAVYNPTPNWRIAVNAAQQEAVRGDTSAAFTALVEDRLPQWQNAQLWPVTLAGGVQRVDQYTTTYITNPLNTAKLSVGEKTPELREWRANFITNYTFAKTTKLKGWGIGGALRWQDDVCIGYPVINDPVLGLVTDIQHPYMADPEVNVDAWLSYQRKIWRNVNWKIQVNVRNLFNDNLLVPVKANPVAVGDISSYDIAAWRIGAERTWELTSTFSF